MSERKIAESKVRPYLRKLGFSEELISKYGSVPVQFGTTTGWVDFVCYYPKGEAKFPFLVVEVKITKDDMNPVQAESYAQRLKAPFFALTNGDDWHWYWTGEGQSNSLRLRECPIPRFEKMESLTGKEKLRERKDIMELVEAYEEKVKTDERKCPRRDNICSIMYRSYDACSSCLIGNLVWINAATEELSKLVKDVDKVSGRKLADTLSDPSILWAIFPQNITLIRKWVSKNTHKVREIIKYLANENLSLKERFDSIVARNGEHHILGMGPFLASMLFAALNSQKYTIISDRNIEGLKRLNIIDIQPTFRTGADYASLNDIMVELGRIFEDRSGYGRSALVHDFTFRVGTYFDTGKWRE